MEIKPDALAGVMNGIITGIAEEDKVLYGQAIKDLVKSPYLDTPDRFNTFISWTAEEIYTAALSDHLAKKHPLLDESHRNKLVEVYLQYQLLDEQLANIIEMKETGVCSYDKSGYLINSYMKYVLDGDMAFEKDDKCFWKPSFGSGQLWIEMIEQILRLKNGNIKAYSDALLAVLKEGTNE